MIHIDGVTQLSVPFDRGQRISLYLSFLILQIRCAPVSPINCGRSFMFDILEKHFLLIRLYSMSWQYFNLAFVTFYMTNVMCLMTFVIVVVNRYSKKP